MRNRKEAQNKTWTRLVVTGTLIVGVAQVTAIGMGPTIHQKVKGANDSTGIHNESNLSSPINTQAFDIGATLAGDTSQAHESHAQSETTVTIDGTGVAIAAFILKRAWGLIRTRS